jgi:AcrR family transcriptional regulator
VIHPIRRRVVVKNTEITLIEGAFQNSSGNHLIPFIFHSETPFIVVKLHSTTSWYNDSMENVNKSLTHRQRQALATQKLIVDTARLLFLEQGYGATTIEAISAKAGVAVSTVYSIYKNKRGILKAIREEWHQVSGQRDIYQQALQEVDPSRRMALAAHATRRQWEHGAIMMSIYLSAAAVDSEAAAELKDSLEGRRAGMTRFIQGSASILRSDLTVERASAIYLSLTRPEVYQELVDVFHWTPDEYEHWLAETLRQQLL